MLKKPCIERAAKVIILTVIINLLFATTLIFAKNDSSPADTYYDRGLKFHKEGQLFQALDAYDKAIQLDPRLTYAYYHRGLIYSYKGDHDKAITDFTKAIELNDKDSDFYNERGIVYNEKKLSDKAIEDFTKAIALNPKVADYYNGIATAYSGKKDYTQAVLMYTKSIELDSKQSYVYYNRGLNYSQTQQYDAAIADFNQAIQYIPEKERDSSYYQRMAQDAYFDKALACEKAGYNAEAVASFRQFLKYAPPAFSTEIDYAKTRLKELR